MSRGAAHAPPAALAPAGLWRGRPAPFAVWAPRAAQLTLRIDDERLPMLRRDDGWFVPERPVAAFRPDGSPRDYGYQLGDDPLVIPDPRGLRLPGGVHGRSRTFDPAAHRWGDRAWPGRQLAGGIIYELHIGTFTPEGTLDAAIGRLDHLAGLGITHVEPLPVNAFNGEHGWGYDGVAWFTVHEAYGGPAAYQRFVDACHARGLAVIQDVVYNHLGPSGNYLGLLGPYLSPGSTEWGDAINLDGHDSEEVRRYILGNARMWIEDFHVDGLRLDAVHALADRRAVRLLTELGRLGETLSAELGRPVSMIAESDMNDPRLLDARRLGGDGLDAQWSDDYHHAVHVALTGETDGYYADFEGASAPGLDALAKVLRDGFFHDGSWSSFRGRRHGRPFPREMAAWRLVACAQNHDQIGNRARGDRFGETLDEARLVQAAVLVLCAPFTPMLFMGEEWGAATPFQFFSSHPEPELGRAVSEGRLREFSRMGWDPAVVPDPQDLTTFRRSKLDWSEAASERGSRLLRAYRELIELRRTIPALSNPWLEEVRCAWTDAQGRPAPGSEAGAVAGVFSFWRGPVRICLNMTDEPRELPAEVPGVPRVAFAGAGGAEFADGVLRLPPRGAAVILPG